MESLPSPRCDSYRQQPSVPAIVSHQYSTSKELMTLEPFNPKTDGRIPMVIEAARRIADECPEADVRIPLSGPFSLATNLMGFENLLCEIMTGPDLVARMLSHFVAGQVEFCKEVVRQGLDAMLELRVLSPERLLGLAALGRLAQEQHRPARGSVGPPKSAGGGGEGD